MQARRYQPKDLDMINSWIDTRETTKLPKTRIPKTGGFIVDDVACGFLIKTNIKIGIIEYFVSNPLASNAARLEAYQLLFREIEKEAKKLGFEILMATTKILKVAALAVHNGMVKDPDFYFCVRKLLNQGEVNGSRSDRDALDNRASA